MTLAFRPTSHELPDRPAQAGPKNSLYLESEKVQKSCKSETKSQIMTSTDFFENFSEGNSSLARARGRRCAVNFRATPWNNWIFTELILSKQLLSHSQASQGKIVDYHRASSSKTKNKYQYSRMTSCSLPLLQLCVMCSCSVIKEKKMKELFIPDTPPANN